MTCSSWLAPLGVDPSLCRFEFEAFMDEQGGIAAVVHDELGAFVVGMRERVKRAVPILPQASRLSTQKQECPPVRSRRRRGPASKEILQLAQRTDAPSSLSVSMRIAVSMVMCSEPVMRTPCSGFNGPYFLRMAMRPGISCSET